MSGTSFFGGRFGVCEWMDVVWNKLDVAVSGERANWYQTSQRVSMGKGAGLRILVVSFILIFSSFLWATGSAISLVPFDSAFTNKGDWIGWMTFWCLVLPVLLFVCCIAYTIALF